MLQELFNELADLLHIPVNHVKSMNSTGGMEPIVKEMVVASGLRFLRNEDYKSIAYIFHGRQYGHLL